MQTALRGLFRIPHSAFCIRSVGADCTPHSVFRVSIPHSLTACDSLRQPAFCIPHSAFRTGPPLETAFCIPHSSFRISGSPPQSAPHSAICILHPAYHSFLHSAFCILHSAVCILHSAFRNLHPHSAFLLTVSDSPPESAQHSAIRILYSSYDSFMHTKRRCILHL